MHRPLVTHKKGLHFFAASEVTLHTFWSSCSVLPKNLHPETFMHVYSCFYGKKRPLLISHSKMAASLQAFYPSLGLATFRSLFRLSNSNCVLCRFALKKNPATMQSMYWQVLWKRKILLMQIGAMYCNTCACMYGMHSFFSKQPPDTTDETTGRLFRRHL